MLAASNVHYELSDRDRGLAVGGIGAMHRLVRHVGLAKELDEHVEVLKAHRPYHESDHVLNIAYNVLSGGQRLEARSTSLAFGYGSSNRGGFSTKR
jgi:hypothetical protein